MNWKFNSTEEDYLEYKKTKELQTGKPWPPKSKPLTPEQKEELEIQRQVEEIKKAMSTPQKYSPACYRYFFRFGKYKNTGKSLAKILEEDRGYLEYIYKNFDNLDKKLRRLLGENLWI